MTNTRGNITKLLDLMAKNSYALYEVEKRDNNEIMANGFYWQYSGIKTAIQLLNDNRFFNAMLEVYKDDFAKLENA